MKIYKPDISRLLSARAIKRAQKIVKKYNTQNLKLSVELMRMRRLEAESESLK